MPDKRIQTKSAARRAAELAQLAANGLSPDAELDEQILFAALHTCAFRASRCTYSKTAVVHEREGWSTRWQGIREYIVNKHQRLAYSMLRHFNAAELGEDSGVSEAMFGLARAVERFNPWKGHRFSTYACNVIARALMRCASHESRYCELIPVQQDADRVRPPRQQESRIAIWVEQLNRAVEVNSPE